MGRNASCNLSTSVYAKMRYGFNAGIFGEWRLNKSFVLSPELLFSMRRFMILKDPASGINYRYNYLILPIMAKFYLTKKLSIDVSVIDSNSSV